MERCLAAIFVADVVGYSRLIRSDEEGTLAALKALRADLIDPKIAQHQGRVVKLMGDGMLAEFPSVVDAVRAAVETQQAVTEHNSGLPEDKRIEFRVGINLGDIIIDGEDIQGDGVNVAARLEGLAQPGGVCISGSVHEQVRDRLDVPFEDLGEKEVKNIARPVRVWQWPNDAAPVAAATEHEPLTLPDKPSIAVLPFDNLSGDPEQEFFADGMAEDIITGLSRFRSLFVIARNSTFAYKGKSPDVREVAQDLGVRYILEGSVRRGGQRIRITAQLIDAEVGSHLWAERYDRDLEDIFAIQDEVTDAIVAAISPEIDQVERNRAQRKPPESLDAWSLYQRGLTTYHATTKESLEAAIKQFDKVNELDPGFAPAYAMAADARTRLTIHYSTGNRSLLSQAQKKASLGITLDARDPDCLWADGKVQSYLGHHDIAVSRAEEAVVLNPNSAMAHQALAFLLGRAGRPEDAISHITHDPYSSKSARRFFSRVFDTWVAIDVRYRSLSRGFRMG